MPSPDSTKPNCADGAVRKTRTISGLRSYGQAILLSLLAKVTPGSVEEGRVRAALEPDPYKPRE
jgi:hypothetical protein